MNVVFFIRTEENIVFNLCAICTCEKPWGDPVRLTGQYKPPINNNNNNNTGAMTGNNSQIQLWHKNKYKLQVTILYSSCVRFVLVKSPEVTLSSWLGYKPTINNNNNRGRILPRLRGFSWNRNWNPWLTTIISAEEKNWRKKQNPPVSFFTLVPLTSL